MKRSIEFDLRGNSLGGGVGRVRLYHVRERGSGEAKVGYLFLEMCGKGRRKASRNRLEEYVSKRKGFLIEGKQVFILREDGNCSGKVEDRRDIFVDGTKAGTGKRYWVQRTGAESLHL